MDAPEIVRYCNLMEDIKRRIAVVDQLGTPTGPALPPQVRMESIYLQYRKILELIAFGSLVSNLDKFSKIYARFSKYWNAAELFREAGRVVEDPEQVGGFAEAIEALAEPDLRRRLGEAARAVAATHGWDAHVAALRALFAQVRG